MINVSLSQDSFCISRRRLEFHFQTILFICKAVLREFWAEVFNVFWAFSLLLRCTRHLLLLKLTNRFDGNFRNIETLYLSECSLLLEFKRTRIWLRWRIRRRLVNYSRSLLWKFKTQTKGSQCFCASFVIIKYCHASNGRLRWFQRFRRDRKRWVDRGIWKIPWMFHSIVVWSFANWEAQSV